MTRPDTAWWMTVLLAVVFFGVSGALFANASSRPFGWITLVSAVVALVAAWIGHRRSTLRP